MTRENKNERLNKAYETDASGLKGKPEKVFIPENIAEVQSLVRENECVVPRGGGTGLVGGCVPRGEKPVVVDISKLNKILKFSRERKTIEVEAGIILDELNDYLFEWGLEFPIQPSSHQVCTIGGMIATDAVGSRAVKYGRTSRWVDWVEIVDSKGDLIKKGKTELADFAGIEGITGVIVKAGLRLEEKKWRSADFIKRETLEEAINLIKETKRNASISMVEFFDKQVSLFLGLGDVYHVLIEYESDEGELKGEAYEEVLALRDKVYPVLAEHDFEKIEDPKVFVDKLMDMILWFEDNKIPVYGHASVGILHPCFSKEQEKLIPLMMKVVKKLNGKVSGEHGIGLTKKQYLDENDKKIIGLIKKRNDPLNKFNPDKVI